MYGALWFILTGMAIDFGGLERVQGPLPVALLVRPCGRFLLITASSDLVRWTSLVGPGRLVAGFELTEQTDQHEDYRSLWFIAYPHAPQSEESAPVAESAQVPIWLWRVVRAFFAQGVADLVVFDPPGGRWAHFLVCLDPVDEELAEDLDTLYRYAAVSDGPESDRALLRVAHLAPGDLAYGSSLA